MKSFRTDRFQGWASPALEIPPQLLAQPEGDIGIPEAHLVSESRARRIWMAPLKLAGEAQGCIICVFRNQSLSRALRPAYAFHAMRLSEKLRKKGFGTFKVVAALKRRGEVLNWNSLLIARRICRVSELPSTGSHVFPVHPVAPLTDQFGDLLAESLARFHDQGFVHGDLKSRHILVPDPAGSNGHPFYLVDLEKTKHLAYAPGPIRDIFAARDLIQLFASLPSRQDGRDLEVLKTQLLERYLVERGISSSRRRRIAGYVSRYSPGGSLQQGETLLRGLLNGWRGKAVGLGSRQNGTRPEQTQTEPSKIR